MNYSCIVNPCGLLLCFNMLAKAIKFKILSVVVSCTYNIDNLSNVCPAIINLLIKCSPTLFTLTACFCPTSGTYLLFLLQSLVLSVTVVVYTVGKVKWNKYLCQWATERNSIWQFDNEMHFHSQSILHTVDSEFWIQH